MHPSNKAPQPNAVVLLSGGQDSTTCLFWAAQQFEHIEALVFDYGQRHSIEIAQAQDIARLAGVKATVLDLSGLGQLGGSALTDTDIKVPVSEPGTAPEAGIPTTFVPARNLIFLSYAAAYAYPRGIRHIVLGVGQVDYSGYPDCRAPFVQSAALTLSLALDAPMEVHTPLLNLSKAQIWQLATDLGCLDVVVRDSHTCYQGDHTTFHSWGYGCGSCAACHLRAQGYYEAFPQAAG
jgi:7-cyano-7-deazaguanine synthase